MNSQAPTHSPVSELQTVALRCGEWQWVALRDWAAVMGFTEHVPWLDLGSMPDVQPIKTGPFRTVWRLPLGGHRVVAKVFHRERGWRRLKTRLLGPAARREFAAALAGRRAGLPVVRPVAWGRPQGRDSSRPQVLLTEEVSEARPLADFWLGLPGPEGRRREADNEVIKQLAAFLASLHQGGLVPSDLHPGNILVQYDGETARCWLIDLHGARANVIATQAVRVRNLVELNQWFQHHASRQDRLRFLLAYLLSCHADPSDKLLRWYVREVSDVTEYLRGRLARKRDRRIFGSNNHFAVLTLKPGWKAHVLLRTRRSLAGSRCSHLNLTARDWHEALPALIAAGGSTAVLELDGRRIPVTVQRGPGAELRRTWEANFKRIHRHQPAALPLALLERRGGGRVQERVLVIESSCPEEESSRG